MPTPGVAQPAVPQAPHRPPLDAGRQHQPRRRAGRPAGRPAPDGGRLQRDRERRPGRDAAHRHARGGLGRPRPAGDRTRARGAGSTSRPDPRGDHVGPAGGRERPGRHVGAGVRRASRSRSPARPAPPSAARRATSPGTSSTAPYNDPRIVVAVTIERGGFGAEAAAPAARRILAAYFGIKGKKAVGTAGKAPELMVGHDAATPHPSAPASSASASRARASCGSTSCCCSATLGLIAFSLVTLDAATAADVPGSPRLLRRSGRASTRSSGLVLMLALASIDYSRFRELRDRPLRGDDRA